MSKKKTNRTKKVNVKSSRNSGSTMTRKRVVSTASEKKEVVEKRKSAPVKPSKEVDPSLSELPFGKMNYILLGIGVLIIAFGFWLMSLDPFIDATEFSVSLYIAPIIVVAGFIEIIFAIMYQPPKPVSSINTSEAENI